MIFRYKSNSAARNSVQFPAIPGNSTQFRTCLNTCSSVACLLPSRVDLLCCPRITAVEELSLVTHLVSYRGSWKHRLKQNFIFSLEHWKRSLIPRGNTSHPQWYQFFTRLEVRTGLLWKIPFKRSFRDHNSPFCIRGAVLNIP